MIQKKIIYLDHGIILVDQCDPVIEHILGNTSYLRIKLNIRICFPLNIYLYKDVLLTLPIVRMKCTCAQKDIKRLIMFYIFSFSLCIQDEKLNSFVRHVFIFSIYSKRKHPINIQRKKK